MRCVFSFVVTAFAMGRVPQFLGETIAIDDFFTQGFDDPAERERLLPVPIEPGIGTW